jgi:hypothetical protein
MLDRTISVMQHFENERHGLSGRTDAPVDVNAVSDTKPCPTQDAPDKLLNKALREFRLMRLEGSLPSYLNEG